MPVMQNPGAPLPRLNQVILDSIADGVYTVDLNWRVSFFQPGG